VVRDGLANRPDDTYLATSDERQNGVTSARRSGMTQSPSQANEASAPAPTEYVALSDPEFKKQLALVIPHLRAFGRSLSGNRDLADDLVQETLLKAWAARKRFQAGTNMRAWTFIILRNLFLSQMRRARFKGEWDDLVADRVLAAPASQDKHVELADMQRALMHLIVPTATPQISAASLMKKPPRSAVLQWVRSRAASHAVASRSRR
jgi:hypothetical protein